MKQTEVRILDENPSGELVSGTYTNKRDAVTSAAQLNQVVYRVESETTRGWRYFVAPEGHWWCERANQGTGGVLAETCFHPGDMCGWLSD